MRRHLFNLRPGIIIFLLTIHQLLNAANISILFIGNSYTYTNNMPFMVQQMALNMGDTIFVDSYTPGGYTLQMHSADANTLAKINQQPWDYVVLQEQSQLPSLSPAIVNTQVIPYALLLDSIIKANHSCTKTIFYMTWGRKYGDTQNCPSYPPVCTYTGMQQRLKDSYKLMADTCKATVAPVGKAFENFIAIDTILDLYSADYSHPSLAGSFLAASVIYGAATHKQITNHNYTAGLDTGDVATLYNVAWQTIKDSASVWNMGKYDAYAYFDYLVMPNYQVQFTNASTGNYVHHWDFGDTTFSNLAQPTHQYNASSSYNVTHTVYDTCSYDSITMAINVLPVSLGEIFPSGFTAVFSYDNMSVIIIPGTGTTGKARLTIMDIVGNCVYSYNYSDTKVIHHIDVNGWAPGLYFLQMRTSLNASGSRKIVIY